MASVIYNAEKDDADMAMKHARRLIDSADCCLGNIDTVKVLIDGELYFRWQFGKGITFPDAAELAKGAK